MGLRVFSLTISLVVIEITYTLSYYHHQIGSMKYYPLFKVGHEKKVCTVCLLYSSGLYTKDHFVYIES